MTVRPLGVNESRPNAERFYSMRKSKNRRKERMSGSPVQPCKIKDEKMEPRKMSRMREKYQGRLKSK